MLNKGNNKQKHMHDKQQKINKIKHRKQNKKINIKTKTKKETTNWLGNWHKKIK